MKNLQDLVVDENFDEKLTTSSDGSVDMTSSNIGQVNPLQLVNTTGLFMSDKYKSI